MIDPATATTLAAGTSMLSAVGIFGYVRSLVKSVRAHERTLHGEPAVDGWDGIVPMVQQHEEELGTLYDMAEIDEETGRPYFPGERDGGGPGAD